jgi:hypothetical protein
MITEVPTEDIQFVSEKIQEIVILAHQTAKYDTGYIYLLDMADRLLQGCRERIKGNAQREGES